MAHHRRPPQHRVPSPPARTYPLRRSPTSRSRQNTLPDADNTLDIRPVLVPLHPNLRRLPSRLLAQAAHSNKTGYMAPNGVHVGSKRKRVASVNTINENTAHVTRSYSRTKRLRSDYLPSTRYRRQGITTTDEEENVDDQPMDEQNGEEDASSEMDIDMETNSRLTTSDGTEVDADENEAETASVDLEDSDDGEDDTDEDDSTDDHLLNSAEPKQLLRLRKHDLIRLYNLAGLTDDAEAMTKSDLVDAIVTAREDFADLPPSSPPGRGDGNSSDYYSSDDGNIAAGEETDVGIGRNSIGRRKSYAALKRRATMEEVRRTSGQPAKSRSMSMGHLLSQSSDSLVKRQASGRSVGHIDEIIPCKRRASNRSSPSTSTAPPTSNSSPLVSRLRSRKVSATAEAPRSSLNHTLMKAKGKGKGKQVEFSDDIGASRSKRYVKHDRKVSSSKALESDLTDIEELEKKLKSSPRRLRNRSVEVDARRDVGLSVTAVRRTPTRKAKMKIGSLKEEDSEEAETAEDADMEDELVDEEKGGAEEEDVDAEEEEVDELVSSASQTPTPPPSAYKGRRTPLRRRLRPRKRLPPPPSDGDDEDELAEENEEVVGDAEAEDEEAVSVMDEGDGDTEDNEDDEDTIAVEPRKLRNGKIVGEEDVEMDMVNEREEDEEGSVGDEDAEGEEGTDVDQDGQGDVEEVDAMQDDDIDLTAATAKTLIRLRRDDLIRLCETRNLEPVGTKPQLAEVLLQWRDQHANGMSSPSSTGTVRPPSTKRGRRRHGIHARSSGGGTPPTLLHSEHMHDDEPKTPMPQKEKEPDPDLELDLESLGLEDREIPPDKLQKLEKIGSGGFKDVYIGKFKGRKIAIAEFRGQLSAMDIKELKLLGGFDHPNIVRFLGVSIPENTRETPVMIVSELCSNGDLFDYIRNVSAPSLHKVLVMMLDIARGLEYLHTHKPSVIHRDCKSSNILITAKGTAKIADFGLAKVKQSTRSMVRSLVGTVNWQAPELWHAHPKYNYKVDVFSCAMVYWEILQWHLHNKKFPWEGMNEHAIYEIVGTKRQRPSVSGLRKQWCPEIVDLIERMWAHDPQDRPTMSEVVEALEEMIAHY